MQTIIAVIGSKGGVGKSTIVTNMLLAARLAGLRAAGVDLDITGSLAAWAGKRFAAGMQPATEVITGDLAGWQDATMAAGDRLVIVDTPPSPSDDAHIAGAQDLAAAAQLTLIPCLARGPVLERIGPVGATFKSLGAKVVFVLNEIDLRTRAARGARSFLSRYGDVAEVEIPTREDVHWAMHRGRAVVEDPKLGGHEAMASLWRLVAERLGLPR